jgi:hypothetical protein
MVTIRSCKDCSDRFPGCHDRCERYKADKEACEAEKKLGMMNGYAEAIK